MQFNWYGFTWNTGDKYVHRIWLALRKINPKAARMYFFSTRD